MKNPKNVLLTGATGFLGAFILHHLLLTSDCTIFVLMRAKSAGKEKEGKQEKGKEKEKEKVEEEGVKSSENLLDRLKAQLQYFRGISFSSSFSVLLSFL